jgi:hypothetical protein
LDSPAHPRTTSPGKPSLKKAAQAGRTLIFIDESDFYLLPSLLDTYAQRGATPVLKVPLKWEHLSVIGAITRQGQLVHQVYAHAISKVEPYANNLHIKQSLLKRQFCASSHILLFSAGNLT